MELITAYVPKDYTLINCSDLHFGSPNTSISSVTKMIDRIKDDPTCFVVINGDMIEAITPSDKRFTFGNTPYKTPQDQAEGFIELFRPIANKIIAVGFGNHEYKLLNTCNFGTYIADSLGVPFGFYCFKTLMYNYQTGKLMHKMYFTHGNGSITSNAKDALQQIANKKAALKNKLIQSGHGDCIFMSMGHTHQLITVDPIVSDLLYLTDDGDDIHQNYHQMADQTATYIHPDARWYANSGSFMKLYSKPASGYLSYAEVAGYAPSEIGYIEISVRDEQVMEVKRVIC